jgi:hypothetical protein
VPEPVRLEHELASGRFGLRASFLPDPGQGRFEWRIDSRKAQTAASRQEVWIQDPWGQLQGVFSWLPNRQGPWAGWWLTDPRGRPILPEQQASSGREPGISPQALQALAELLHSLRERLESAAMTPTEGRTTFTLRQAAGADWVELRIALDDRPDCREPSRSPAQSAVTTGC